MTNPSHKLYALSEDGKTLFFGSYPQSKVTDAELIVRLNALAGELPDQLDSKAWTDYGYYLGGKPCSCTWFKDIELDGCRYRGEYFTQCRPACTASDKSVGIGDQSANGYDPLIVHWFKWEPIKWCVLSNDGKKRGYCPMSSWIVSNITTR